MQENEPTQIKGTRIQKIIANNTHISRRKAEILIEEERVRVNGIIAHIGQSATENDTVTIDDEQITRKPKIYLCFNKPKYIVCSKVGEHTIYDFFPPAYIESGIFSVGRLDKDAEGLLFITNDGTWANKIAHPSSHIPKTYNVWCDRVITQKDIKKLSEAVKLDEGTITPLAVSLNPLGFVQITINIGWHKVVKRIFQAHDFRVKKLKRIAIGNFALPAHLKPGEFRELSQKQAESIVEEKK